MGTHLCGFARRGLNTLVTPSLLTEVGRCVLWLLEDVDEREPLLWRGYLRSRSVAAGQISPLPSPHSVNSAHATWEWRKSPAPQFMRDEPLTRHFSGPVVFHRYVSGKAVQNAAQAAAARPHAAFHYDE